MTHANKNQAADGRIDSTAMWVIIYIIFIFYFMFQSVYFAQGYGPFTSTAYVAYPYRTILTGFLFFFPFLWLLPEGWRDRSGNAALILFAVSTIIYFGIVVSRRPELASINDRAEALSTGIRAAMNGQFPYLAKTNLNNLLSPLTTSFLLALPAELIYRRPELMNLVFLFALLFILAYRCDRNHSWAPFPLVCALVVFNPIVIWELTWGSDLMWGSLLLLLALLLMESDHIKWAAIIFGLTLCTRLSFMLLVPMLFIFLLRRDRAQGIQAIALILATLVFLELPLILWDPDTFFHWAPVGLSNGKFSLPMPAQDNLFGDLINSLHIPEAERGKIFTALLLLLSAGLGWVRPKDLTRLAIHISMLFAFSLFLIGPYFLRDYLVWVFIPLLYALTASNPSRPIQSRDRDHQSSGPRSLPGSEGV